MNKEELTKEDQMAFNNLCSALKILESHRNLHSMGVILNSAASRIRYLESRAEDEIHKRKSGNP